MQDDTNIKIKSLEDTIKKLANQQSKSFVKSDGELQLLKIQFGEKSYSGIASEIASDMADTLSSSIGKGVLDQKKSLNKLNVVMKNIESFVDDPKDRQELLEIADKIKNSLEENTTFLRRSAEVGETVAIKGVKFLGSMLSKSPVFSMGFDFIGKFLEKRKDDRNQEKNRTKDLATQALNAVRSDTVSTNTTNNESSPESNSPVVSNTTNNESSTESKKAVDNLENINESVSLILKLISKPTKDNIETRRENATYQEKLLNALNNISENKINKSTKIGKAKDFFDKIINFSKNIPRLLKNIPGVLATLIGTTSLIFTKIKGLGSVFKNFGRTLVKFAKPFLAAYALFKGFSTFFETFSKSKDPFSLDTIAEAFGKLAGKIIDTVTLGFVDMNFTDKLPNIGNKIGLWLSDMAFKVLSIFDSESTFFVDMGNSILNFGEKVFDAIVDIFKNPGKAFDQIQNSISDFFVTLVDNIAWIFKNPEKAFKTLKNGLQEFANKISQWLTQILSKIPLLGRLFKDTSKNVKSKNFSKSDAGTILKQKGKSVETIIKKIQQSSRYLIPNDSAEYTSSGNNSGFQIDKSALTEKRLSDTDLITLYKRRAFLLPKTQKNVIEEYKNRKLNITTPTISNTSNSNNTGKILQKENEKKDKAMQNPANTVNDNSSNNNIIAPTIRNETISVPDRADPPPMFSTIMSMS